MGKKLVDINNQPLQSNQSISKSRAGNSVVRDPQLLHIGKFTIPHAYLNEAFDDIREFMKEVVVIRAELMYAQEPYIEYVAISPRYFERISHDSDAPVPAYDINKRADGLFVAIRKR